MAATGIRLLHLLVRLGLAGLFLYAGALKLADPAVFAQDLAHYRMLPELWTGPLAVGLPVLEVVAGLALLTRTYMRGGASLAAIMLAVFAAAMAQAKFRGINLDCGCFGAASNLQVSWTKVAINLGLAILGVWVACPLQIALARQPEPPSPASDASAKGSGSSPA